MSFMRKAICLMTLLATLTASATYGIEKAPNGYLISEEEFRMVLLMQEDLKGCNEAYISAKNALIEVDKYIEIVAEENEKLKRQRKILIGGVVVEAIVAVLILIFK